MKTSLQFLFPSFLLFASVQTYPRRTTHHLTRGKTAGMTLVSRFSFLKSCLSSRDAKPHVRFSQHVPNGEQHESSDEEERIRRGLLKKLEERSDSVKIASGSELRLLKRLLCGYDRSHNHRLHSAKSEFDLFHSLRDQLSGNHGSASVDTMISAYSASPGGATRTGRWSAPCISSQHRPLSQPDGEVDAWEFDIWALHDNTGGDKERAALCLVEEICFRSRCDELCDDSRSADWPTKLRAFAAAIVAQYDQKVPYHNCLHGADVMQGIHALLRASPDLEQALSSSTLLVTLLAALAHDVGHPGLTNAHLIEIGHKLAIRYNDQAPLENFHVATALDLASRTGFWDAAFSTSDAKRSARYTWIELTLATDMAHHVHMISDLEAKLRDSNYDAAKNVVPTLKILMHCCDLSNPARPWHVYAKWTDLIMDEFYNQADLEIRSGKLQPSLPTRTNCKLDQFQLAFLGFIRPLFVAANQMSCLCLDDQLRNLDDSVERWKGVRAPSPSTIFDHRAQPIPDRADRTQTL